MTARTSNSRRDQAIADDFLEGEGVCSFCRGSARTDDLNTFGARCRPCYELYCTGGRVVLPLTPQERRNMAEAVRAALGGKLRLPGREHIAMLQARADAGQQLTPGQTGFLQAVRRNSSGSEDADLAVVCTRCGQAGHRASHCSWPPADDARARFADAAGVV